LQPVCFGRHPRMITRHAIWAPAPVTRFTTEYHPGGDLIASYRSLKRRLLPVRFWKSTSQQLYGSSGLRVIQRADHTSSQGGYDRAGSSASITLFPDSRSTRLLSATVTSPTSARTQRGLDSKTKGPILIWGVVPGLVTIESFCGDGESGRPFCASCPQSTNLTASSHGSACCSAQGNTSVN
jgi:hypothetical protein